MKHTALALILAAGIGCAETKTETTDAPMMRMLGAPVVVQEVHNDEAIGQEVRRKLELQNAAEAAGMLVEVDGGVVTLRGFAPSLGAAWRAEAAAHAVKGVKRVLNRLRVSGQSW